MAEITIKEALKVITDAMKEDKSEGSYYYGWQANIAMAFYDAFVVKFINNVSNEIPDSLELHEISNNAAKNFLDMLCTETE